MQRITKIIQSLLILSFFLFEVNLTGEGFIPPKNGGYNNKEFKIVLVVDVSPSVKDHKHLILHFVEKVFDSFKKNKNNDIHLITFAERGKLFNTGRVSKKDVLNEIDSTIKSKIEYTFPKHGLCEVFDLVEENFPKKIGVVLFISDGEDSRTKLDVATTNKREAQSDLKRTIKSLKNNGFTVFSIFLNTGKDQYVCGECMKMIAEWAETEKEFHEINNVNEIPVVINSFKKKFTKLRSLSPISIRDFDKWKEDKDKEIEKQKASFSKMEKKKDEEINKQKASFERVKKEKEDIKRKKKQFTIWGVILSILFILAIIILYKQYSLLKKKISKAPHKRIPSLDFLWGKLVNKNENDAEIDLSSKPVGFTLELPNDFPDLTLHADCLDNKKVITIHKEKGSIRFKKGSGVYGHDYIDSDTTSIKITIPGEKHSVEYKYRFLETLKESCEKPALTENEFVGREEIIENIKTNFLQTSNRKNYIIYGMGNSGKTSLMKKIYEIEDIKQKYSLKYFESSNNIRRSFQIFKDAVLRDIQSLKSKDKKMLIFIDDFDYVFDECKESFKSLIESNQISRKFFIILAGKKALNLDKLPENIYIEPLNSLDSSIHKMKSINEEIKICKSMQLIDNLLTQIGFPKKYITKGVKGKISLFASGIPILVKKILYELLSEWFGNSKLHPLKVENVEKAASEIIGHCKTYMLKVLRDLDEKRPGGFKEFPISKVPYRDILNKLSKKGRGRMNIEILKNESVGDYQGSILEDRSNSFDEKIRNLEWMGFIKEDEKDIVGLPFLFFYKGDTVIDY